MQPLKFSIIQEIKHQGICDASAATALGENKFVVGNGCFCSHCFRRK